MKKVSYIVISSLLTSCISNENAFEDIPQSIDFQPVIYSTSARSGANELDKQTSFGAYAWIGESADESNDTKYIENKEVRFENSQWSFVTPSYWPLGSFYLDFFCYTPYVASNPQPQITVTNNFNTNKIEYKDIIANESTPDYMYSSKAINQQKETAPNGVAIKFNHALAQVKFGIRISTVSDGKGKTWEVKLTKFEVTDITNKGGVVLNLGNNKQDWIKKNPAVWDEVPTAKERWNLLPSNEADKTLTTTDLKILKQAMVIPQKLEDEMQLLIEYDLITKENQTSNTEHKKIEIALNSIQSATETINNWEMNKIISYNVVINPPSTRKPLTFDPSVKEWINNDSSIEVSPNN